MSRHFTLYWEDLTYDKQQQIIEEVKISLKDAYQEEGERLAMKYPEYKNWAWEMVIADFYSLEDMSIDIWETNKARVDAAEWAVEDYLEKQAEEKAIQGFGFGKTEVEVDL